MNLHRRLKLLAVLLGLAAVVLAGRAQIRDGGIDPKNLGKGVWIYSLMDATNKLGGHVASVTNLNSFLQCCKTAGLRHLIVKAATSDQLFGDCYGGPQFTSNLVAAAHANGLAIFGYNRSYGSNLVGEVAMANYVFNQGADGFVFDAEAEWEAGHAWITNGPAQAWQLCATVRSNWPNKFLAHAPFAIIGVHATFPYKEFGYWCDAVMPQVYHFATAGLKASPSATLNWADVNWNTWQNNLASLPQTNWAGAAVNWTNASKPLVPVQDVYGSVVAGGIICESAAGAIYPDKDVTEFADYAAADSHAPTAGGFRGANFWRADTIGTNQWSNLAAATSGSQSNVVNQIVLDDAAATFTGAWNAVRVFAATTTAPSYYGATGTDTNCFGTNYFSKTAGSGAAFAQFTPAILIPGKYDVYQWHPFVTNASAGVPFVIGTPTGTNTMLVNQQTNDGNWSWVGRFNFAAGSSNFIRVLDNFSDPGNLALVDGLKLVYANADIVLDNTNSEVNFVGSWTTGNSTAGRYGADYRYATSGTGVTATATYRPNFPNAGWYDIFLWYSTGANRATNAPWTISFWGGSTNLLVNQQLNGGGWWQLVAARPFLTGTNGFVQLANNAGPSLVMADAVKFSFAGPLTPPAIPSFARLPDGRVTLTVNSTPGYGVWLDRATNLTFWQPLTNLLNAGGTLNFTDAAAGGGAAFYRVHQ